MHDAAAPPAEGASPSVDARADAPVAVDAGMTTPDAASDAGLGLALSFAGPGALGSLQSCAAESTAWLTSAFTWEGWFSFTTPITATTTVDTPTVVVGAADPPACEDVRLGFSMVGGPQRELGFYVDSLGGCAARDLHPPMFVPPSGWVAGQWYYFAAVHDYVAQTSSLYLDGSLVAQTSNTSVPIPRAMILSVGRNNDGNAATDPAFPGSIDEVRLYSRALSASEIHANASSPHPGAATLSGLTAGWHFDESSGSSASDFSSNGHDMAVGSDVTRVPGIVPLP